MRTAQCITGLLAMPFLAGAVDAGALLQSPAVFVPQAFVDAVENGGVPLDGAGSLTEVVTGEAGVEMRAVLIRSYLLLDAANCLEPREPEEALEERRRWWDQSLIADASGMLDAWVRMIDRHDLGGIPDLRLESAGLRRCVGRAAVTRLAELLDAVERARNEAAAIVRVIPDRPLPPEGLPSGSDPSLIRDAEARLGYEEALARLDEYHHATHFISTLDARVDELINSTGPALRSLLRAMNETDRQSVLEACPEDGGRFWSTLRRRWLDFTEPSPADAATP